MPEPAPILTYDAHSPVKDPRARWVIPAYWLGMILAGMAYAIIATSLIVRKNLETTFGPFDGLLLPGGMTLLLLLPATISLGTTLWLRQKIIREVRFAKFRTAVLWGIAGGLYPAPMSKFMPLSDDTTMYLLIGALVWHFVFPVAAGCFLCYRSHLRD